MAAGDLPPAPAANPNTFGCEDAFEVDAIAAMSSLMLLEGTI